MKKTVFCLSVLLSLPFTSYSQAAPLPATVNPPLPSIAPDPKMQDAIREKCLKDCQDKHGEPGGVTCEQICGVATKPPEVKNAPKTDAEGNVENNDNFLKIPEEE